MAPTSCRPIPPILAIDYTKLKMRALILPLLAGDNYIKVIHFSHFSQNSTTQIMNFQF